MEKLNINHEVQVNLEENADKSLLFQPMIK